MARLSLPPAAPHLPGLVTALLLLLTSGLACAALPGLPAVPAKAPAAASTPADGAPAAPAVETIPASDIPIRADVDERFAQDVLQRTRGKDPSPKLGAGLDELTRGIVQLSQSFKNDNLRQLSAIRLESLDNHWKFYQRELNEWRAELDATTGVYTDDAAELARRRVTWEATRSGACCKRRHCGADRPCRRRHCADRARGGGDFRPARRTTQAQAAREHGPGQHRRRQQGSGRGHRLLRPAARDGRCRAGLAGLERH